MWYRHFQLTKKVLGQKHPSQNKNLNNKGSKYAVLWCNSYAVGPFTLSILPSAPLSLLIQSTTKDKIQQRIRVLCWNSPNFMEIQKKQHMSRKDIYFFFLKWMFLHLSGIHASCIKKISIYYLVNKKRSHNIRGFKNNCTWIWSAECY